ncbi:MAG: hypothetical protein ABIP51_05205 [Bacteroidia bacterium]
MINEIKKDLYKSKEVAKFSHYSYGKLFYTFKALDKTFMFPIHIVEKIVKEFTTHDVIIQCVNTTQLSSDLGETNFSSEIKASDLNRWIAKAIEKEELITIS